jgi:hypothetical protein
MDIFLPGSSWHSIHGETNWGSRRFASSYGSLFTGYSYIPIKLNEKGLFEDISI